MKDQSIGRVTVLMIALAVVTVSCMDDVNTDPKNLLGRWQMIKVIHQGKTSSKPNSSDWLHEVEIEFLENGEIVGTLPTEDFTGDYKISDGDSIAITRWKSSKKGIPAWGEYFFYNVHLVTTFSMRKKGLSFNYNELSFNYNDGELIFNRVK